MLRREEVLRESECVWEKERDITYKRERTWLEEVRVLCEREREGEREIEKEGYNTQKKREREDMTHTQALRNIVHSVDSSVYVLVWSAQVVAHTERS